MILFFILGIVLQAYSFIGNNLDLKKIRLCLILTWLAALLPSVISYDFSGLRGFINNFILLYILILPLSFSIIFHKDTAPKINAPTIISYTILFWFVFLNSVYQMLYLNNVVAISFLLTSIYVLYILLFTEEPNSKQMQTLIGWSLLALISIAILEFWKQESLFSIFNENSDYLSNISSGMIFMYIAVYGWHLTYSSFYGEQALRSAKDFLIKHRISYVYAAALIIFQATTLIINRRCGFIPEYWMITIWLLLPPQIQTVYSQYKLNSVESLK